MESLVLKGKDLCFSFVWTRLERIEECCGGLETRVVFPIIPWLVEPVSFSIPKAESGDPALQPSVKCGDGDGDADPTHSEIDGPLSTLALVTLGFVILVIGVVFLDPLVKTGNREFNLTYSEVPGNWVFTGVFTR